MQQDIWLSLTLSPVSVSPTTDRGFIFVIIMKLYAVKSPSGQTLRIWADSIEHAIQLATIQENWQYSALMYYVANNLRPGR